MTNFRIPRRIALGSFVLALFFSVALSLARVANSEGSAREKMNKVLTQGAGFTAEDLKSLEAGETIVKQLEEKDPREVAFSGVIKLDAPRDIVFEAFRRAIETQEKKIATERGGFSDLPEAKDLSTLKITRSEIGALSSCKVGECEWSLSEEMIDRLAKEVNWESSEGRQKANELLKTMLAEYTADYLKRGDSALMVYRDDPEPLSLQDEQRALLDKLLWIDDFAPEFKEYLREFPSRRLEGVDGFVSWSNVKIGLKPVIVDTHTIFYKKEESGVPQAFIISKQIYASHYFHSSLALTAITSFPKDGGGFETYVFFVSHSRAGALTGTLGQIARVAVDGEAENKLTGALEDTKRFTAYALGGQEEADRAAQKGLLGRILGGYSYLWLLAIAIGAAAVVYLLTRKPAKE
jgi:hypothetical protein